MEKRRLGSDAYGGCEGESYRPYVPTTTTQPEFTARAVIAGILIGIVFGAANAYLGLKVGLTVSASVPAAVIAIALGRGLIGRTTVLENNMIQTIGSSGEAIAAGVVFTIPALIVLGFMPELSKIFALASIGGLLGIFFMIPLRRYLIVREHRRLLFPEGVACAEVLVAGDAGGTGVRMVMSGLGLGALYEFLMGAVKLWQDRPTWNVRGVAGAQVSGEVSAALLGVGYIIGPRIAAIMLAGGALSWLVIIPLIHFIGQGLTEPLFPATVPIAAMQPADIWNNYIRYIGVGAVAFGGLVTLVRAIPTIGASFGAGLSGILRRRSGTPRAPERTDTDLPMSLVVFGAVALIIIVAALPQLPVNTLGAVLIAVFSFFFVTVTSRLVGVIGSSSNPASGMTIATLLGTTLVFRAMGWTGAAGMIAAVSVGSVVCIAICSAADISQDLKTGFLVGATPRRQQTGEIIGALTSAAVIGWVVFFLHRAYGIGSEALPAPQAVLMSMVVKGVLSMSLPWGLVFIGVLLAACFEILGIPSLPLAVGLYLPLRLTTPIVAGGLVRAAIERARGDESLRHERRERGVLFSSGLIAAGGLMGILVAGLVNAEGQRALAQASGQPVGKMTAAVAAFYQRIHIGPDWAGGAAGLVALGAFLLLALALALSAARGGPGERQA
jgi:putative OPT family oligopeptide transporter